MFPSFLAVQPHLAHPYFKHRQTRPQLDALPLQLRSLAHLAIPLLIVPLEFLLFSYFVLSYSPYLRCWTMA